MRSEELFSEAQRLFPGGVNSPVRAFRAVGGTPRFIARGQGPYLFDVESRRYIDYVLSWGPLVLGHAAEPVVRALQEQIGLGTSFGAPTELENRLAQKILSLMPRLERLRFVNSGTEATMSAIRLARAYTRRSRIVKFAGNYHGHGDFFLVQAGSGVATLGLPDSPGVPEGVVRETLVAPYNDVGAVEELFQRYPEEIAAVIVEPVAGNMGLVPPKPGFLSSLEALCRRHGALFILDEVMTGFRVALGGAQSLYDLHPDLVTLGKVIGGGLPVGAYGGRAEIMELVAPAGPVYQAGTLSGNPLAMAAGLTTLEAWSQPGVFERTALAAQRLCEGLSQEALRRGIPLQIQAVGTMWGLFFSEQPVWDYSSARATDRARYARFFHRALEGGVYLAPSPLEAAFISASHTPAVVEESLSVLTQALADL
jgi:glutamate-1-semialdehyde 2,1-aminomutase